MARAAGVGREKIDNISTMVMRAVTTCRQRSLTAELQSMPDGLGQKLGLFSHGTAKCPC